MLTVVALVATLAFAASASADWGSGWGHMGYGPHHRGMMGYRGDYGPPGGHYGPSRGDYPGDNLSREQIDKMEAQRESFLKETEPLRQGLYEKEMALRSELAKETPDVEKARQLQREISDLRGEFEQARLAHQVEMRKIAPDAGRGYAGRGRGPRGGGYGHGYGYGHGPGACWR
jgi:zinc resistance-associated protein